jgi:predicted PurR-regulated permease PerM
MIVEEPSHADSGLTLAPEESAPVLLHMPVDVRSLSLAMLATLASIFALRWASDVFIPVMAGLLLSYALSPLVDWLQHYRVPRAVSAALLILSIISGFGSVGYWLSDDASKLIELLPAAAHKLRSSIHTLPGNPDNTLITVQKAAIQLEQAAEESTRAAPLARGVQRVQIEKPKFDVKDHLWSGTLGLLAMAGQVSMVALIAFFLMASGDSFRRKLIKLVGPTLSKKRITLQALNQIHDHIQRYMLVQLFTSTLVGLATWACFLIIGVEHAAVWGIAAGVLDLIPYIGSVIITTASMLMTFLQFGEPHVVLLVGAVSILIHVSEAFLLTPWLTSRANKMSPFAIFIGVLAWGWLWGVWGLLLGVPILVIIKAICDRVDDLKPVGEFLGA